MTLNVLRRWVFIGMLTCLGSSMATQKNSGVPAPRPNILLIVADDMGWADVGYHGSPIRTPHIDRLTRQGVVLDQYAMIGKMIETLGATGQRENTLVIFFSDNGGTHGDGNLLYPGGKANAPIKGLNHPLRGWKAEVYEGGIRVPAFVHWPKTLKPRKVSIPVHVTDWMPTICALLDMPEAADAKWDGVDIWPTLMGDKNAALANRELYCQGVHRKSAALRQGHWKLVVHRREGEDRIELFDLSVDSHEKRDHSAEQPQCVATMLKARLPRKSETTMHCRPTGNRRIEAE
jgi:arylsulfatase A-like enzyme